MAKVDIKFNRQKLQADIIKRIDKVIDADPLKKDIGIFATTRLRFEARKGTPLNDERNFPPLKPITIDNREYLARFNRTHPAFNEARSNVTLTGQLLNALGFQVISRGVELLFIGERRPYRTGPNSVANDTPTNQEVADYLAEKGFRVFTKKGIESDRKFSSNITQIVRRFLRRSLK